MPEQYIVCPYCKKRIPLTEAISHQVKEELAKEFEGKAQKLEQKAYKKALESVTVEMKDLAEQVKEKDRLLGDFREKELAIRKERRKVEEERKALDLEIARKLDGERKRIEEEAVKRLAEEHRFKDAEKDKLIKDMQKQVGDLKRRAEQGSMQVQGEVMEVGLEKLLKDGFPSDRVERVLKGVKGADVIQVVVDESGVECGKIAWESKRTKAWSDGWLRKLKDDAGKVKADVAALVSEVLPKGVRGFGFVGGVWVLDYGSVVPLATALRMSLIGLAKVKLARVGKAEKMEVLYAYLSGAEFRNRVEAIVESFSAMREDLEREKRAMGKIWAKREKQIERVVENTVGMYGDLEGIMGRGMPRIESLELKALASGEGGEEE